MAQTVGENTVPVTIKMSKAMLALVDACVKAANDRPRALGRVTRSDVMRSALDHGLKRLKRQRG